MSWVKRAFSATARWVAPSLVAASAAALIGGAIEAINAPGLGPKIATLCFVALVAVPALFVLALVVRGLVAAWRPRTLAEQLRGGDGAAPRLAGWLAVLWVSALVLAAIIYRGTWLLADATTFEPIVVSFVEPLFALVAGLVLLAVSRPLAGVFEKLAIRIDARWRRTGRTTLLTPRRIIVGAIGSQLVLGAVAWFVVIKPAVGTLDVTTLATPVVALVVLGLGHADARRWRRARWPVGGLGVAAVAGALVARHTEPSLVLELWGDQPVAGFAIDLAYDLDEVRDDVPLGDLRPVDRPGVPHPDILLITIDTVRADHTPPYGGSARMPVLRDLAARGTLFTWAFAPSNVTRRSIPALVIGLTPDRIRGRVVGWALRIDPRYVLLAERLRAGGYETAGFMCCKGFWSREVHTGLERGLDYLEIEKNGALLTTRAASWLAERERRPDRKPLFLWMHLLEPHNWNAGLSTKADIDRGKYYDRVLGNVDSLLGLVVDAFRDRAPDKAPIVIVSADHGEGLGEHGHDTHSSDLYNSQLRVPLVFSGPGVRVQQVPETVSLIDLVPTIVELAGFEPPSGLDGRSLADVIGGKRASVPDTGTAYAAMIKDRSNPGGLEAIVVGRWKLIVSDRNEPELYDIYADPDEKTDLADQHPAKVDELQRRLVARREAAAKSPFAR